MQCSAGIAACPRRAPNESAWAPYAAQPAVVATVLVLQNTLYELSLVEGMGFQREALAEEEPASAPMQQVGGGGHAAMHARPAGVGPTRHCT